MTAEAEASAVQEILSSVIEGSDDRHLDLFERGFSAFASHSSKLGAFLMEG